jgi:hypothetical protein
MAVHSRNHPLPRASLAHNLATYYANQLATAAATVLGNSGHYAQVGLYNNGALGYLLYVIGCSVWNSDTTGSVTLRTIQQIPSPATITAGIPLNPLIATLEGELASTPNGTKVGGNAVWRLSGGGTPENWPYDAPLAILPAGYALYTDPDNAASTVSAAFRWIVMKS